MSEIEKAKWTRNYFAKKIVAKLLGSLDATPLNISVIETVLVEYDKTIAALEEKPSDNWPIEEIIFGDILRFIDGRIDQDDMPEIHKLLRSTAASYHARECAKCREKTTDSPYWDKQTAPPCDYDMEMP